ncbi:MAG: hypothetical protein R2856_02930 [Caldilineaceae bacterium]
MAAQIGTIFVERKDQASRKEARRIIAKVLARSAYPPVIVFPEGRLGLGDQVLSLPLRHLRDGVFDARPLPAVRLALQSPRNCHLERTPGRRTRLRRVAAGHLPWAAAPLPQAGETRPPQPRTTIHASSGMSARLVAEAVGLGIGDIGDA